MQWYYVVAIVVAILVGATGIVTAIIKGVWTLSTIFGDLRASINELRIALVTTTFKIDETQKDVTSLTAKVEDVQLTQQSLQVRTIRLEDNSNRLEEKVDKLS